MEFYSKVGLEEDRTSAMSIWPTLVVDSAVFSVKIPDHDRENNSGKPILVCEHFKKQWHTTE